MPKESTSEVVFRTCLGEIDRCIEQGRTALSFYLFFFCSVNHSVSFCFSPQSSCAYFSFSFFLSHSLCRHKPVFHQFTWTSLWVRCLADKHTMSTPDNRRHSWVPRGAEIPNSVRSEYDWVDESSITHMEILHGNGPLFSFYIFSIFLFCVFLYLLSL